jgi:hypothetical protein
MLKVMFDGLPVLQKVSSPLVMVPGLNGTNTSTCLIPEAQAAEMPGTTILGETKQA